MCTMKNFLLVALYVGGLACALARGSEPAVLAESDVVVVGGTLDGVRAAIAAKEAGASVFLVAPRAYLGEDRAGTFLLKRLPSDDPSDPVIREIFNPRYGTPTALKTVLATNAADAARIVLTADLGSLQPISGVCASVPVHVRQDASFRQNAPDLYATERVVIELSDDGTAWRPFADLTRADNAYGHRPFASPFERRADATCRYVRATQFQEKDYPRQEPGVLHVFAPVGTELRGAVAPFLIKRGLDKCLLAADVPFRTGFPATDILRDAEGQFAGIVVASRNGFQSIRAKVLIDATMRGRLAERAGGARRAFPSGDRPCTFTTIDRTGKMHVHELMLPFADGSALSFLVAEQIARDRTWAPDQADAADRIACTMPDTFTSLPEGIFAVGPCAESGMSAYEAGRKAAEVAKRRGGRAGARPSQSLPVLATYDVVVAGGGTGGAPAGIAAARQGAKTLVLEFMDRLGGQTTEGCITGYYFGNRVGFTKEIDAGRKATGTVPYAAKGEWYRRSIREAGGDVWFGSFAVGVETKDGRVTAVIAVLPDGTCGRVVCKTAIDDIGFLDDTDAEDLWFFGLRSRLSMPDSTWDQAQIPGSRERRRLVGAFYVTPSDVMLERTYPDTICRTYSNFDTHGQTRSAQFFIEDPPHAPMYVNLPYRALLPKKLDGLLVTGLGMSAHRDAMPILRMEPDVQNQGYAAGVASAMAVAAGVPVRAIRVKALQHHLAEKGIIPFETLEMVDNFPPKDADFDRAIHTLPNDYDGLAVLMSDPARAIPRLKEAWRTTENLNAKLTYAHVLGMMGDRTGEETLLAKFKMSSWDKGWNYRGMSQFMRSVSWTDSYAIALGRAHSLAAREVLDAKAAELTADMHYSHFRALALAYEGAGDSAGVPALARLLKLPGVGGHAIRPGAPIPSIRNYSNREGDRERTRVLKELCLARAIFNLGDTPDGLGRRTLEAYAADPRRAYANHARLVLAEQSDGCHALFISPQDRAGKENVAVFERRFANAKAVRRATWSVTAQGVFEAYVNGSRVGNDFLKPGVTESGKCRHVYSYDVTALLMRRTGETNVLSATVSPGWWCDQMMRPRPGVKTPWQLGKEIAFRGELHVAFEDGSHETFGTDEKWLAAYTGPVVSAGIYEGEVYDARRGVSGLKSVRRNTEFAGELRPAAAKIALRDDLVLKPREMYVTCGAEGVADAAFGRAKIVRRYADGDEVRLGPGEMLVVDFAQNCSAVPSFEVTGEVGTELEIRASEMLNESNGEKSRGNDGPAGTPYLASLRSAYAGIRYTLKDGAQSYMPRFTYFGYRYLGVTATKPVMFRRWRSTPVSSVTKAMEAGRIVTGNGRVNRLIENIRWGLLSNYLSSPTDCPQRDERMGWTADTQVFMNSAAYLADTKEFLGKYLADLRDAQRASGCYMCFVPNVRHTFPPWASAGWTDAGVIMPYRLWKWYGDRRFVDDAWDSMTRYMDFLESHEDPYRINHGDWLAFEHHLKAKGDAMDPRQVKALNAYFRVWMAMLMREMASATGRADAARHYADEEAKLRRAFTATYMDADGTIKDEYKGQCNDLYMLKLGLCGNAAAEEKTKRDLIDNIRAHGDRLQTGFLGTAILMPVLTFKAGAPELAYSLLLQEKFPSWLYSVDQGATTVWERWDGYTKEKGFGPVGMNSFNHYAYGCVMEWLFAAAAGIRQEEGAVGWSRFMLAPIPDRRIGSVKAEYRSPAGLIKSAWRYEGEKWIWAFTVPEGAHAVVLPPGAATPQTYAAGSYKIER